jgi:hypothetical protein
LWSLQVVVPATQAWSGTPWNIAHTKWFLMP